MKKILLILIALAASVAAWAWDGSGTQADPYLIKTTDDLVTLATNSADNDYGLKHFRLENDLDMAGVSIEPIGNYYKRFKATFDGNGHVISNLTISKPESQEVGLFGYVSTGFKLKNLIIDGASITGKDRTGVLVGHFSTSCNIENCLVVNSHVNVTLEQYGLVGVAGIIIGVYSSSVTLSDNYYRNCSITKNDVTSTTNIGASGSDREGANLSNASITLPDGVSIISGAVAYNGIGYTVSGATVTLGGSEGFENAIINATYTPDGGSATACTDNGDGTFSFTMPDEGDVTVNATFGPVTWAVVSDMFANASADADAPTEIILAADITAGEGDTFFNLPSNRHLVLDLNGHTIDRNMSEAASNGYVIAMRTSSSLTIRDSSPEQTGTITGGWGSGNVGCIGVNNATLRLEGGSITGNRINNQGGSAVTFAGDFYMTGGTITGNIANTANNSMGMCGAVYFASNANFYMSGGAITGNYCGTTTYGSAGLGFYLSMGDKNVHLSGSYTLSGNMQGTYDATTGAWSDLQPSDYLNTNRCYIRIDDTIAPTAPMTMVLYNNYYADFTRGWSTFMDGKDPENYFTLLPYVTDRGIGVVEGEATICTIHTITLGDNITASTTSAMQGKLVTLGYNGNVPENYKVVYTVTIDGSDPAETVDVIDGTFVMPDADVTVTADLILDGFLIDEENFPDANFRNYLLSRPYGTDGVLTDEEIAGITSIYVSYENIADLTGIEHFTALRTLECNGNQLTSLDVSQNTALKRLDCGFNQLAALDVSHNTALERLDCYSNQLAALDVSHNTALTTLMCDRNQLTALDVSHNTALKRLDCYSNQLAALDVSHNTALERLDCYSNQLAALDVSQNTALKRLACSNNQLAALDVSNNTALEILECYDNQLTVLDVSHNTALTDLKCYENRINGENMEALVASLPAVDVVNNDGDHGYFYVINLDSETEQNVITTTQVATAIDKNWTVFGFTNGYWEEYDGSEPTTEVPGDVNGDGSVTAADVTEIYNYLLNGDQTYVDTGDVNGDGSITSADITAIYSILLGQ